MRRTDRAAAAIVAVLLTGSGANAQAVRAPGGFVPRHALSYGSDGQAAVAVDDGHPLPVSQRGRTVTYTDRSGTIAAAGTAQPLAPANAARGGFFIENLSTGDLWITSLGTATIGQPAIRIAAGQLYEFPANGVPGASLSIVGATAGQSYAAREW